MNEGTNVKQQIVERIKNSTNILVTVSTDPSVDELSAALGLTLLLNKLNKHATAVVSGELPPAITFLDPQKTFENSVDSLRDFIIALDKEKADHLRYKVEGDVVKIFITPYRTTISSDDLDFSQGDYNVELVIALGVKNKDHLDTALAAHGRILHDATVATLTAGDETSDLGSLTWHDDNASSLSEMLVGLSEAIKTEKAGLDEQTATAFLTGIVAATDRFSNNRTSSRAMTMAAQLMAAGANQQLIAAKLQEAHEIGPREDASASSVDGTTDLEEGQSTKLDKTVAPSAKAPKKKNDGSLSISHEKTGDIDAVGAEVVAEQQEEAARAAEDQLAEQLEATKAATTVELPSVDDLQQDIARVSDDAGQVAEAGPLSGAVSNWQPSQSEPQLGGTLNATSEQAADDRRREEDDDRNRTILTHGSGDYVGDSQPTFQSPINAATAADDEPATVDPFAEAVAPIAQPTAHAAPLQPVAEPVAVSQPEPTVASAPTLADIDQQNRAQHDDARAAVEAALNNAPDTMPAPFEPAQPSFEAAPAPFEQPVGGMPPLPDFSTLPPLPPLPDFSAQQGPSGAVSADKLGDIFGSTPPAAPEEPQAPNPGQFRIPGQ